MRATKPTSDGRIQARPGDPDLVEAFLPTPVPENHASFLHFLPDGSLACTWFGGSAEGQPDVHIYFSILPISSDSWSEATRVSAGSSRSEQNPVLFSAPGGDLWLLYTAQEYNAQDTAVVMVQKSDDGGASWSHPEQLFEAVGLYIRQPMIVLTAREWVLPVFHCDPVPGREWHGHADTSAVYLTQDGGATWKESTVPDSRGLVHMCVLKASDDSLLAFFRSRWADAVYRSTSADDGQTWSGPVPLDVPNNNSSIQVTRTDVSGRVTLLMVLNPVSAPSGSSEGDDLAVESGKVKVVAPGARVPLDRHAVWGQPRLPLSLMSSIDDGRTWTTVLELENEHLLLSSGVDFGDLPKRGAEMSYPTVVIDEEGTAHIAYSYLRDAIKYVRIPMERWGA